MVDKRLRLHEEVMLLALHNDKGTVASGTMYSMALGGAILAELLLERRIEVERERKKTFARVLSRSPVGDPLIDECLRRIVDARRRGSLQTWVSRFANMSGLRHRVAGGLARKNVLRADEDTVLLIFKRRIYPELDPRPERRIVERLREAIFTEEPGLDGKTVVLVALAHHAGLLKHVFDKRELRRRKQRIESIIQGNVIGKATREAIQAVQAAIAVAAITPVIVAASSS